MEKYKKRKQRLAIAGIVLLVVLYLTTIFTALFDKSATMIYFKVAVVMTILVPIFLYIYTMFYKLSKKDQFEDEEA